MEVQVIWKSKIYLTKNITSLPATVCSVQLLFAVWYLMCAVKECICAHLHHHTSVNVCRIIQYGIQRHFRKMGPPAGGSKKEPSFRETAPGLQKENVYSGNHLPSRSGIDCIRVVVVICSLKMAVLLYHYTSLEGLFGIKKMDYVRPSSGRDARHGPGVYLTSKHPLYHTEIDIAENNFDGAWKYEGRINKVQLALEFRFTAGKVRKLEIRRGADVWLYQDTLQLNGYFTGSVFNRHLSGYKTTGVCFAMNTQRTPSDARHDFIEHGRLHEQQMKTPPSTTSDVLREDILQGPGVLRLGGQKETSDVLRLGQIAQSTPADALRWMDFKRDSGQTETSDVLRSGQIVQSTPADALRLMEFKHDAGQKKTSDVMRVGQIAQNTPADVLFKNVNVKQDFGHPRSPGSLSHGYLEPATAERETPQGGSFIAWLAKMDSGRKRTLQTTMSDLLAMKVKERRTTNNV